MGKMMEQGPVLIITFQTQQIMTVKDAKGKVVEGDPVSVAVGSIFLVALINHHFLLLAGENISGTLCLGPVSRPE